MRPVALTLMVAALMVAAHAGAQTAASVSPAPVVNVPATPDRAARADSGQRVIRGRATAAENGMPLRRVRILILAGSGSGEALFSDDDGQFAAAVADSGRVMLFASKAGYESAQRQFTPAGDTEISLSLHRAAVISGRVANPSGRAVPGQRITLARLDAPTDATGQPADIRRFSSSTTDDRGEYRFAGLPAGRYVVSHVGFGISHGSVIDAASGGPPDPDSTVSVAVHAGDEARVDLAFDGPDTSLTKRLYAIGAGVLSATGDQARAIEGTVTDEHGELLEGVSIDVLYLRRQGSRLIATRLGATRQTDDRGRYRSFDLPPGEYLVRAAMQPDAVPGTPTAGQGHVPVYYPGTVRGEFAAAVSLATGDAAGIDFRIVPDVARRVTGTVIDSTGQPFNGSVRLLESTSAIVLTHQATRTDVRGDGGFVFASVPPGDYVVMAGDGSLSGRVEFGSATVMVTDRDPPPTTVYTSPGTTLRGRLVVEGEAPAAPFSIATQAVDPHSLPVGTGRAPLTIEHGGEFAGLGLHGPTRFVITAPSPDWFLKSVTIDGRDVSDTGVDFGPLARAIDGVEIVVSPRGASVVGRVANRAEGKQAVIAVPAARGLWGAYSRRMRTTQVNADGSFAVKGLPGGEYYIAAVASAEPVTGEWETAEWLDAIVANARTVTLFEGEQETVILAPARP